MTQPITVTVTAGTSCVVATIAITVVVTAGTTVS